MMRRRVLTDIPQADLASTKELFESYGWAVQTVDQGDGLWTLIATKDDGVPAGGTPATRGIAEPGAPKSKTR
ncbi:MAG TPA: hypothetical protein VHM90_00965, partial [Phycisphaerae bacterium]|nr:hypothetical protein [Phycisphaerae bacterium]